MIAEAIEKILTMAKIQKEEIGGEVYVKHGQGVERLPRPAQVPPAPLVFATLSGLAQYYEDNVDRLEIENLFFHVVAFDHIQIVGPIDPANANRRFSYAAAVSNLEPFPFGKYFALEDFVVRLQTQFASGPEYADNDLDAIIGKLSQVAIEHVQTHDNDKFSQSIQIRTGLAFKSEVKIENPVRLYPWRTFDEIRQPMTPAVLRFDASGDAPKAGLFEAGPAWQAAAMKAIKQWLMQEVGPRAAVLA
jgi:hypothetical protein